MMLRESIKILLLLLLLSIGAQASSFATEMRYLSSYDEALESAKKLQKPMMVVVGTNTCPWCRKMERQTLKRESIDTIIKSNFIPLILKKGVDKFPKAFNPAAVPTIFFVDSATEQPFFQSIGYKNSRDFTKSLEEAIEKHKKRGEKR